jgi:ATP-dependent RNA helicase DBP3
VSYTFFQPTDKARAGELQQVMRQADQNPPDDLLKFGSTIKKKEHKMYGNFGPRTDAQALKQPTKITFNYSDDEEE